MVDYNSTIATYKRFRQNAAGMNNFNDLVEEDLIPEAGQSAVN
jgi:hypothetical protein